MSELPVQKSGPVALPRQPLSLIILTGFMGAGKSTAGRLLAEKLGWRFLDADDAIEEAAGMPVAEIFRAYGEMNFRKREMEAIHLLSGENNAVLALGGGAIENPRVRSLLKGLQGACLIFLDAPLGVLLSRCQGTGPVRPLLSEGDVAARYERRLPLYREAHITVETDGLTPEEVAGQALRNLEERWPMRIEAHGSHGQP